MKLNTNTIFNRKKFKINFNNLFFFSTKVILSIVILFITIIVSNFISKYIESIEFDKYKQEKKEKDNKKKNKEHISVLLSIIIKYTIYLIGIYIIFLFLGFNTSLILATFGTFGIAIALGLQGSLSNLVAGILLSFTEKIKLHSIIETNVDKGQGMNQSLVGELISFDILTVEIKDVHTGLKYTVNNSKIWESVTSNYNYFDNKIYITVEIKISEDNDFKKVLNIIKNVCLSEKKIIKEDTWPSPFINMYNSDNICGVTVMVKFLTDVKNYPNIEDTIQNDIILKLKENNIKLMNCSNIYKS